MMHVFLSWRRVVATHTRSARARFIPGEQAHDFAHFARLELADGDDPLATVTVARAAQLGSVVTVTIMSAAVVFTIASIEVQRPIQTNQQQLDIEVRTREQAACFDCRIDRGVGCVLVYVP
jgi:hypothetical protein